MNRRQFVTAFAQTGASLALAGVWPGAAAAADLRLTETFPPRDGEVFIGTLHAAAALHPGFAFFAGLPAAFGIDPELAARWRMSEVTPLWQALQRETGLVCMATSKLTAQPYLQVAAGGELRSLAGLRFACEGLARDVAAGLGAEPVSPMQPNATYREWCTLASIRRLKQAGGMMFEPLLTRVASEVFVVMTESTNASCGNPVAVPALAGARLHRPKPAAAMDRNLPADLRRQADRVAAAVIADLAATSTLTRTISSANFRCFPSKTPAEGRITAKIG